MSEPMADLKLKTTANGALMLVQSERETQVQVRRCFPWRKPGGFVSLSDKEGKELALIDDPARLDEPSRAALDKAMALAGFTMRVSRILAIEEEIELRTWSVDVAGTIRSFQTELDEWPQELPGGLIVVKDVSGDLYSIDDPSGMDATSRRLLWALCG